MNTHKRVLLALAVIGLFLAAALPGLAQEPAAANLRPEPVRFSGRVTSIEGTVLALHTLDGDLTFQTGDRTRFRVPGVQNPTLADVRVGDTGRIFKAGTGSRRS